MQQPAPRWSAVRSRSGCSRPDRPAGTAAGVPSTPHSGRRAEPSTPLPSRAVGRVAWLRLYGALHDAVAEVGGGRCVEHAVRLELDVVGSKQIDQPLSAAEQHGYDVEPDLLDQAGLDELARDVGTAH